MPIQSLLLSLAVCAVFLVFAVVLAWVDYRTTRSQRTKEQRTRAFEKPMAPAAKPPRKAA